VYNLVGLSENDKSIILGDDHDEKKCTKTVIINNESTITILSMAKIDYSDYFVADDVIISGLKPTEGLESCMISFKGGWV